MVKNILLSLNILWVGYCSYSLTVPRISQQPQKIPSLQALNTKSLFFFNTQDEKQALNHKLKTDPLFRESLKFDGLLIEDLDLSDMCLKDIDFRGCKFKQVKFNGSDLSECEFKGCEFDKCDLKNAILYYSSDITEQFKVQDWDHFTLVKLYSSLIQKSKLKQEDIVSDEALAKARTLNKFFPGLKLDLRGLSLRNLDLTDINLENANLSGAHLQGIRLSDNVEVPDYPKKDRSELFTKWIKGDPEEQEIYQKLANARFNLILGVEHTRLVKGIEKKKKDLKNTHLFGADLKGANLSQANLQNAKLYSAHLEGADLSHANLQKANLLSAYLEGTDLSQANLKNADLYKAHLEGANLSQANLQNACLRSAHLEGADLREAIIARAYLSYFFRLPPDCKDEDLMKIYQTCDDQEAKDLLKVILKAKDLWVEQIQ